MMVNILHVFFFQSKKKKNNEYALKNKRKTDGKKNLVRMISVSD